MVFGHGRGDRSRSRATSARSGRIPTHEPERRRRLWLPAARAAQAASSRPFPPPAPSPRSLSPYASLCRVLACAAADPLLTVATLSIRPIVISEHRTGRSRDRTDRRVVLAQLSWHGLRKAPREKMKSAILLLEA